MASSLCLTASQHKHHQINLAQSLNSRSSILPKKADGVDKEITVLSLASGEYSLSRYFALTGGFGYRFAKITRVKASGTLGDISYPEQDWLNFDGSKDTADHSGLVVSVTLRLYFGG